MKLNLKPVIASVGALAITGGVLAASVGTAAAATTPPWEPDPNALGNLSFFDATGAPITGGTNLSQLFAYAKASTADANNGTKATIYFAAPTPNTDPGAWPSTQESQSYVTPPTAPPSLATSTTPVGTATGNGEANLTSFIAGHTAQTAAGYANVYQVRVATSGGDGGSIGNGQYWESDILVSGSSWSVEYPAAVPTTATTVTSSANPSQVGSAVTFTAHVAPVNAAGTVDFKDTTANVDFGNGTYTASTGVATISHTFTAAALSPGDTITATFVPTDPTAFGGSSGTVAQIVNPVAPSTTTTLAVTQDGTVGDDVKLVSTVSSGSPATPVTAGTVSFYDNGSTTPLNATPVTSTDGTYTFDIPTGLTIGSHSIVAKFTPTDVTAFAASQSSAQTFSLQNEVVGACAQSGSACTDVQNIEGTIPVGTLVISTPYSAQNPLNLGTLALNAGATEFTANAPFTGITVTDTRSGNLPWTVSALASNLTDGGTNPGSVINAQNVGLTTITATPGNGFTGTVTPHDNPAADPAVGPTDPGSAGLGGTAVHDVADANHGEGTVVMQGTLTLNAPTSTEAGLFQGTITFTVG